MRSPRPPPRPRWPRLELALARLGVRATIVETNSKRPLLALRERNALG